ncbi:hypothetical protein L7F22_023162 [Adiantum nelumboides]|nr:hypothetical protein [Adiantum nelumboides]
MQEMPISNLFLLLALLLHQDIFQLAFSSKLESWHDYSTYKGLTSGKGKAVRLDNGTEVVLYPVVQNKQWMVQGSSRAGLDRWQRRRLSPAFSVCSECKCCDGTQTVCSMVACCFSIVCNAPKEPFGLCSFSPSTCDCLSCPADP